MNNLQWCQVVMTACVTFGTAIKHTEKNTSSTLFPSSFFFSQGKISISRSNLFPSLHRERPTAHVLPIRDDDNFGWKKDTGGLYSGNMCWMMWWIIFLQGLLTQLISFSAKRQHHIQNLLISLWKMYHLETQIASWALGQFIWNQLEQLRQGLKTCLVLTTFEYLRRQIEKT